MEKYVNDIQECILNFDIKKFFEPRTNDDENGAILLITPKQVILSLNSINGNGSHVIAFAKTFSKIYGIPINKGTTTEFIIIYQQIHNKIMARLVNEKDAGTFIAFMLTGINSISLNEFHTFERFYQEYNETIKNISKQYGYPIVHMLVPSQQDWKSKTEEICCDDLTPVLDRLRTLISKDKIEGKEKEIIEYREKDKEKIFKKRQIRSLKYIRSFFKRPDKFENQINQNSKHK